MRTICHNSPIWIFRGQRTGKESACMLKQIIIKILKTHSHMDVALWDQMDGMDGMGLYSVGGEV